VAATPTASSSSRRLLRWAAGLGCLLPLCACTTLEPEPESAALDIPVGWSTEDAAGAGAAAVSATSLVAWWQHFDDPVLNLWEQRALRDNPRVRSAQAALGQALAQRDAAAAALGPSLDASASVQTGTAGGKSTGSSEQLALAANLVPDVFGAGRAALQAAAAAARASTAALGDVEVQVAAEAALDYIGLRTAQARLALARDNLASQQDTLQITDWRQQAGLVTALEVEQARAAVAQTRALLPALQTRISQARHALAVLARQPPAPTPRPAGRGRGGPPAPRPPPPGPAPNPK
jgi:outer membrane protein TolC